MQLYVIRKRKLNMRIDAKMCIGIYTIIYTHARARTKKKDGLILYVSVVGTSNL